MKEGQIRIPSGCAIAAMISKTGTKVSGEKIINALKVMHERSNGLGGGFAGYGIYEEYKDFYAFHIFFENNNVRAECENFIKENFEIVKAENIPVTKHPRIKDVPLIWRYFVTPFSSKLSSLQMDEKEYVVKKVFEINTVLRGAYVFSSGKNMGVFKAVGYPEDVGEFYRLNEYKGYLWTGHGRYPTNTPGWWGGAHPFALLDYSVVHNGEISSYDANRRFIEMYGYKCSLQTDTEVITYIFDYLVRKVGLTIEEASHVVAAPFWETIAQKPKEEREELSFLRHHFSNLLVTGPFSIVLGFENGLLALNDRLKLRSMVVGTKDDFVYIASEEAGIRSMEEHVNQIYSPMGGEPIIVKVGEVENEIL